MWLWFVKCTVLLAPSPQSGNPMSLRGRESFKSVDLAVLGRREKSKMERPQNQNDITVLGLL
jgi:hypothetical protein